MARPTDSVRKEIFVETLKKCGGSSGNPALRDILGWNVSEYWRIRKKLIEDGKVAAGKGKGGSTHLAFTEPPVEVKPDPPVPPGPVEIRVPTDEASLYSPCMATLRSSWFPDQGIHEHENLLLEITAIQGSKPTGGTWTRPEISGLSVRTFVNIPGKHIDIWTFEIKPSAKVDVTGIFEAAAHARSATRSYALFHVPASTAQLNQDILDRATDEARRLGVGLITFADPTDYATWETLVVTVRQEPAPELLDEFIQRQVSEQGRNKLQKWLH